MAKIYLERQLDDIIYPGAAGVKTLDLPRNGVIRGLHIRLTGTVTTTATAPTGQHDLTPYRLIRRIDVIANGKDTIKSIPFWMLRQLNHIDSGVLPFITREGVTASTAFPIEANGFLPFAFTRARRPLDGALDARRLSTLQFVVTFGDITDFYATPNAATLSNVKVEVKTEEYTNVEPDFKAFLNKHSMIQHPVTAARTDDQERMAVERVYRRFLLFAENVAASGQITASAGILNKVTLKTGSFVYKASKVGPIQGEMKTIYGIDTLDTGVFLIDNTTDGLLSEALNAKGLSSLEFVFDVSLPAGTNTVYIFPEEVFGGE